MRAGSGACGVGIRTRVSGGFRETADAGSSSPLQGGGAVGKPTTALQPSATARPALRPGGSDWSSCTGIAQPQRAAISGSFQIDSMRDAEDRNRRARGAG
jgi:hypothetical protein